MVGLVDVVKVKGSKLMTLTRLKNPVASVTQNVRAVVRCRYARKL